jgi:hypothetical protein
MSRYQWPSPGKSGDRAYRRMGYNALTNGVLPPGAVRPAPPSHPGERIAPTGDAGLWVPIGPSTVMKGQAGSRPRVAGRVRDLAISPDGQRAYAATANGGVWYSSDAGGTWSPLGNWVPTPTSAPIDRAAQPLTCGCLLVTFGAAADGSADDVYVGTGELVPRTEGLPGSQLGGVGVLHLDKPLPDALADPFGRHWKREAKNLTGVGIYRLARDPGNPNTLVAATSIGLFTRSGAFVEDSDWTRVTASPFNFTAADFKRTSDVAWAAAPTGLWVALMAGSDTGVYTSTGGLAGPFQKVALANVVLDSQVGVADARLGLALAPSDPTVVYALGSGPRLWRISGMTPTPVQGIPDKLFRSASDQSYYDLAITVHPDNKDIVVLGGAAVYADNQWSASIFKCTIAAAGGGLNAGFLPTNQNTPANDPTFIGNGVHSDVHQLRFLKVGTDFHMWVGCDGGVFRSRNSGNQYTFLASNSGLAVLEPGFVASHPESDAFVIVGAQDNGALLRVGDTVWMRSDEIGGDAGCALIHPVKKRYFAAQYNQATWSSNGTLDPPVMRGTAPNAERDENQNAFFYSGADLRTVGAAKQVRLVIGTNRVWLADKWDPDPHPPAPTTWVTLPSKTDPRAGTAADVTTDTYDKRTGSIVTCRWVDDSRLLVLMQSTQPDGQDSVVLMLTLKADGTWERKEISKHVNKCSDYSNGDISQPTSDYLPPLGGWSDLAIHDPTRGANGSFYVACTGHVHIDHDNVIESDRMDTLWWYDGSSKWYPTTLRTANSPPDNVGTKAPAYAVLCDPGDPTVVYVGTALGVWRGAVTFAGPTPTWKWQQFSNGLPEAPVQDLSLYQGAVKLLRAAIQSRGVWEVDISAVPGPTRRTFLRVHANDARRADTTSPVNPMRDGPANWPWNASPDVRIRPAPLAGGETAPAAPASLPWNGSAPDVYLLWIFQTALHKLDPLCRANGMWTEQFAARLAAHTPAEGNAISATRWNAVVTAANVFSAPWDGTPTEADLFELIKENGQSQNPALGPPEISVVKPRQHLIDVLVHHRDLRPVAASDVRVALLRRPLLEPVAGWPSIGITMDWKSKVEILIGGGAPGFVDGWTIADTTSGMRQPSVDVDARLPRVVTFTVDFTGAAPGSRFLLLAVVHSVPDPLTATTLVGDHLQDLIRKSHQLAARVVEVRP